MRRSLFLAFVALAACATGREDVPEGWIGDVGTGPGVGGSGGSAEAGGSGGEGGDAGVGGEGGSGGGAGNGGSGGEGGSAGAGGSGGEGGDAGVGGEGGSGGGAGNGGSGGEGGSGGAGGSGGEGGSGGSGGEPEPPGPVDRGVYSYERVVSYDVVNPPAAAWHSSGSYALVLNTSDKVFRYDQATKSLSEVGGAGSSVSWRAVTFTSDGEKAVLLGNTSTEGRIYVWDHGTQALSEMPAERHAGGTYEAIAYSPDGSQARLLGSRKNSGSGYNAFLWPFDADSGRDISGVKATFTSAGCEDIAWATDEFDNPAIAVVCGINGGTLMHLNGGGVWVTNTGNTGNTSRIGGRPQGDYALAMGWTTNISPIRVFRQGKWVTASVGLNYPRHISFSTDGRRALILGSNVGGLMWEYRHELMVKSEFTDVSIPNFTQAPYNADTSARLHDVAWRPGCDEGLIVGGVNSYSAKQGFVIRFAVDNGKRCDN